MNLLLIGDHVTTSARTRAHLASQCASVQVTDTTDKALELLCLYLFDAILLTLPVGAIDSTAAIRRIRAAGTDTPILALTDAVSPEPKISALAVGADDVVAQTIHPAELVARLRAIIRRSRGPSKPDLQLANLSLSVDRQEVSVGDTRVPLTGKEFAILHLLMMRKNAVLRKETILHLIYGGMDEPELKIIDVFVCKIRRKLAKAGAREVI